MISTQHGADVGWVWRRWERNPLAKMVTKLLSREGPGMLPQSSGTMGRTLLKALGELPEFRGGEAKLHPHHIRIELDDMAKQSIGAPCPPAGLRRSAALVQRHQHIYSTDGCNDVIRKLS